MGTALEELPVLKIAEAIADEIWREVSVWEAFPRDVVGGQLARAADSIGANIAESFGRFHYGEKINHLYYARGSLFESKYWLNRCATRGLIPQERVQSYVAKLTEVARQINGFATHLKAQRAGSTQPDRQIRESVGDYSISQSDGHIIFTDADLNWLTL